MKLRVYLLLVISIISLCSVSAASFQEIEVKNNAGTSLLFPTDMTSQNGPTLFAFILGENREKGTAQVQEMNSWQQALTTYPQAPENLVIYHIPVIEGLPFFLRGIVRNGMRDEYQETIGDEHIAVLFVKSMQSVFEGTGIPFTYEPTLVAVDSSHRIQGYIKGLPTEENLLHLISLMK